MGAGNNNDIVISGNVIDGANINVPGASISFESAERITISGNKIMNDKTGQPIEMRGQSKSWHVADNSFAQNKDNSPASLKPDTTVINNSGYNPVGIIANPWQPSGDITNGGGGSSDPANAKVYTARQTPKTIVVAQGHVSQIAINGTPTGVSAGAFKLGIGETIAITYGGVPTTKVWAD